MGLKSLFKGLAKKPEPTYFLALEIYADSIKSASWEISDNQAKLDQLGASQEYETNNQTAFIEAVDQSFTKAIEGLEVKPKGIIFGLPESWLEKQAVVEKKKQLLKLVCQKFELKPLGFVQSQEALLQFFRLKEGMPLNAVFIRLTFEEVFVWLIKNGQIMAAEKVGRSGDLGADVEEALARFGAVDAFPARLILFNNGSITEEVKEQLESYNWQERLPFLHLPKVEALPISATIEAVVIAGGSEAARSLGFEIKAEETETAGLVAAETKSVEAKAKSIEPEPGVETSAEVEEAEPKSEPETMGFVYDQDVVEVDLGAEIQSGVDQNPGSITDLVEDNLINQPELKSQSLLVKLKSALSWPVKALVKFFKRLRPIRINSSRKLPWIIGLGLGLLVLLATALLAAWWYLPKAEVTIYLQPQVLEKDLDLILDTEINQPDLERSALPAERIEIVVEASQSLATTGTGLVGDPAKGEITLYNKTDLEKTFEAGSVLVGPDNLKFTLDEETSVASQSAEDEGISFGKVKANITAASIGTASNLPAGTEFSFKDYPTSVYSSKTEPGLSGGTSREVKTVAEDDQDQLLSRLTERLENQAQAELNNRLAGKQVLDKSLTTEIVSQDFSYDIGDEAQNLDLDLKLKAQALAFSKSEFDGLISRLLKDSIPDGFKLHQDNLEVKVKSTETSELKSQLGLGVKAKLLPQVDELEIKTNLAGRYPPLVDDYLKTLPNFSSADIAIKPTLPARLNTLPHVKANINLIIKVED